MADEMNSLRTVTDDVLLHRVLPFVGPRSLLKLGLISHRWQEICDDDHLWEPLCVLLWRSKHPLFVGGSHKRFLPHNLIKLTASGWESLRIKELKWIAAKNKTNIHGLFEKASIIARLQAASQSGTLQSIRFHHKWKASFYSSLRDSKRCKISKEELCKYDWDMTFQRGGHSVPIVCTFSEDHVFSSSSFPDNVWRWTDPHPSGASYVQVGGYPPLLFARDKDWNWVASNIHVLFTRSTRKV